MNLIAQPMAYPSGAGFCQNQAPIELRPMLRSPCYVPSEASSLVGKGFTHHAHARYTVIDEHSCFGISASYYMAGLESYSLVGSEAFGRDRSCAGNQPLPVSGSVAEIHLLRDRE